MKTIELWADSFHEGEWACRQLGTIHNNEGGIHSFEYRNGFIPVHHYEFEDQVLEIIVYGSYVSWDPIPIKIKELIDWGKPDFLAYDSKSEKVLFAVEETAAVPTGNQALQRCERQYGSSRAKIPFWYLLPEYGLHKDGGIRRNSIWPSIMALKLSAYFQVPNVVLHYADSENPEGYDFGTGVKLLFNAIYKILINYITGKNHLSGLSDDLIIHYTDMLRFIKSQYKNIIQYVPGIEIINVTDYSKTLASIVTEKSEELMNEYKQNYQDFLVWPSTKEWKEVSGLRLTSSNLLKYDKFSEKLEESISQCKCYIIGRNAGSKPQKKVSIEKWIDAQNKSFDSLSDKLNPPATLSLNVSDFPKSKSGNLHLTTAKNIVYLFDKFSDLKDIIYESFPRLIGKMDSYDNNTSAFVYLSNSLKPGRIFGDPYTGQITAYSTAFGRFDTNKRMVIAYFPHQSFTQIIDKNEQHVKNKGFTILKEMVDFIIFGGGVVVYFNDKGRGTAL